MDLIKIGQTGVIYLMTHSEEELNLQYFLSNKGRILVVTFVGNMDSASIQTIEKCTSEILQMKDIKFVIFYFRDTKKIMMEALTQLTIMQKEVRKSCELQICSLSPDIREKLSKNGVIRSKELTNNLADALAALKGKI